MSATHSARLQGRQILIMGAASGIGRRTAELIVAEGALLTLLDCDRKRLAEVPSTGIRDGLPLDWMIAFRWNP